MNPLQLKRIENRVCGGRLTAGGSNGLRAGGLWRRQRSAFIPLSNRFYCLTVTNRTKEKSSFCGRQRSLRQQRFSDFRRLRRLHREN